MEHLSEQSIELYVLRAPEAEIAKVEAHIAHCAGCRALVEQASAFYAELEAEVHSHPPGDRVSTRSLARTAGRVNEVFTSPFREYPLRRVPPAGKILRFVRRHPVISGGGTLALAGALVALVLMVRPPPAKDLNPVSLVEDRYQSCLEAYNRSGEKLWTRVVPKMEMYLEAEKTHQTTYARVADLDGDGMNETVTLLPTEAKDAGLTNIVHVLNSAGNEIHRLRAGEAGMCRGRLYPDEYLIHQFLVGESSEPGRKDILIVADNLHSPAMVSRYDASGRRIGTYRHFGSLTAASTLLESGGRKILLLCGGSDHEEGRVMQVVVGLDPSRIVGDAESSCSGGFGLPPSPAEEFYLHIPEGRVIRSTGVPMKLDRPRLVTLQNDAPGFGLIAVPDGGRAGYYFEYIFRGDFSLVEVKSENETKKHFDRLAARGLVAGSFFDNYMKVLAGEMLYWDGRAWRHERTPVHNSPP